MKKLFGMVALAACLSLVGVDDAKAQQGPYYIYFTDYCDCITLTRGNLVGHSWYFGTWDWECSGGVSSTRVSPARRSRFRCPARSFSSTACSPLSPDATTSSPAARADSALASPTA